MVGWDVSRHPEWDLMYIAGLTAREIADRCHQNIATVHSHLLKREKYAPGFHAQHEAALEARGTNRPSTLWRQRAKAADEFQAAHGRLPRLGGESEERSLYIWLARQRRLYEKGLLPDAKVVLLKKLSGWNQSPQQVLNEAWQEKLASVSRFIAANNRIPRYKHHTSEQERVLGVWLHNQHQRRSKGTLLRWRLDALNTELPDWHSRQ